MDDNTSIQTNQTAGFPFAFQAGIPAKPMPGPAVPGPVPLPSPPVPRRNKQTWQNLWRWGSHQTRIGFVQDLILEEMSLGRGEKGSIKFRALVPLVEDHMWVEAQGLLDTAHPAGPPPSLPILPLAVSAPAPLPAPGPVPAPPPTLPVPRLAVPALYPLPAPGPAPVPTPGLAPSPVLGQWPTFDPGYGPAPVVPTGGFPSPGLVATQGQVFAPGGSTPDQFAATGYEQPPSVPQPQLQGFSVPSPGHRPDLDDEIEEPPRKRPRSLEPGYTPPLSPNQPMPTVDQMSGSYPGQSYSADQFALPVAPQLAPPAVPEFSPLVPFQLVPAGSLPPAPGWSAQTPPEEEVQPQELETNEFRPQFGEVADAALTQLGEDTHAVAAVREASEDEETDGWLAQPEEAQNEEQPQQADPSSLPQPGTAFPPTDDELPEHQGETRAVDDAEPQVDSTSDEYLFGDWFNWVAYQRDFDRGELLPQHDGES